MTGPPKRNAPAVGVVTEAGAESIVSGVRASEYLDSESPAFSIKQERDCARLCVDPEPAGVVRLPMFNLLPCAIELERKSKLFRASVRALMVTK